jgi:hypothetical protein
MLGLAAQIGKLEMLWVSSANWKARNALGQQRKLENRGNAGVSSANWKARNAEVSSANWKTVGKLWVSSANWKARKAEVSSANWKARKALGLAAQIGKPWNLLISNQTNVKYTKKITLFLHDRNNEF